MSSESYTPGHTQNTTDFMARRSLRSHGEFFQAYLSAGMSVLDCGCGPGSITLGMADRVSPGQVVGVDCEASQIERATTRAENAGLQNVSFQTAECYRLPFDDNSFDRVFSHALIEHLSDPVRAIREFHRVLRSEGIVGVCSPDWRGLLVAPPTPALSRATEAYADLQSRNGGDLGVGRTLGEKLVEAGFVQVQMGARYECYPSLDFIGEYLALQLERVGDVESAHTFRTWCQSEGGLFAQAWISAIGCKGERLVSQ